MEYKILAKYISEAEIKLLLSFIYPDAELRYFKRKLSHNYVEVYYEEMENGKIQRVDFLPDEIYVHGEELGGDGDPIENGDVIYKYQQLMVAKGYSELWKGNPYLI